MRVLVILAALLLPTYCHASVKKLEEIKKDLDAVQSLRKKNLISEDQTKAAEKILFAEASVNAAKEVTSDNFGYILLCETNKETQINGFFNFVNILWVIASIALALSLCWLCSIHLLELLLKVSPKVWEAIAYLIVFTGIAIGKYYGGLWIAFPVCLVFPAVVHFSKTIRWPKMSSSVLAGICAVFWGAVALCYVSDLVGFISVAALLAAVGFSVLVLPLCYCVGFKDDDSIPRTMIAALMLLTGYTVLTIVANKNNALLEEMVGRASVFSIGSLFLGTFVYFTGLLITSSKYYLKSRENYWILQTLTVISGVVAMYVGSVYHIGLLQGVGGTFFILYLLEKYCEMCWRKVGWAWSLLGLSGGLYGIAVFAHNHPEYFLLGLTR